MRDLTAEPTSHQLRGGRRAILRGGILLTLLAGGPLRAQQVPSTLQFPASLAFAGEEGSVPLQSVTDFPYQGFSVSVAYDPAVITILEVTSAGTITEAIEVDFFRANVFPERGAFVLGVLVDAAPPFDDRHIPGLGIPLAVAQVVFEVPAGLSGLITELRFVDGFGDPPIQNVLSISNQSAPPDRLIDGQISIARRPIFLRGDANQDTVVDISDPVFILNYLFQDRTPPPCRDAADGNDDEDIDLADPIFILQYYFMKGLRPPPPFPNPGIDPTTGRRDLGCVSPGL